MDWHNIKELIATIFLIAVFLGIIYLTFIGGGSGEPSPWMPHLIR